MKDETLLACLRRGGGVKGRDMAGFLEALIYNEKNSDVVGGSIK